MEYNWNYYFKNNYIAFGSSWFNSMPIKEINIEKISFEIKKFIK
jgi:hypothetical protein